MSKRSYPDREERKKRRLDARKKAMRGAPVWDVSHRSNRCGWMVATDKFQQTTQLVDSGKPTITCRIAKHQIMPIIECYKCSKTLSEGSFTILYKFEEPKDFFVTWTDFEDMPTKYIWHTLNNENADALKLKSFEVVDGEFRKKYEMILKEIFAKPGSDGNGIAKIVE